MSGGKTALGLDNNIGAMLCYVANLVCSLGLIYSIIVLVTDKANKLPRFHAMQSILLTIAGIVVFLPLYFIAAALAFTGSTMLAMLGSLISIAAFLIGLAVFVFMIIAAVKAYNGEIYKIPVVGNLADQYSN
ncbi:MAG: DUF4870 domain-containing protein [Acidobacteria bacterium]|nr:DUF4870 domain-containing protein [Acidobacteriota bacterium]